jgi:hypothetical protein
MWSMSRPAGWGLEGDRQTPDVVSVAQRRAKRGDLFVLGREAGQRCGFDGGEVGDLLFSVGHPLFELGVVVLEPDDLGCLWVG